MKTCGMFESSDVIFYAIFSLFKKPGEYTNVNINAQKWIS